MAKILILIKKEKKKKNRKATKSIHKICPFSNGNFPFIFEYSVRKKNENEK